MSVVDVYNLQREKISEAELRSDIFDVEIKGHVLHQVVVGALFNKRAGSAVTKSRSDVKGSGAKLWRQKGTGRARAGSISSPTRRGGGVAFGPKQKGYSRKLPKKVRKSALRMALTDKFKNDNLFVVDDFSLPEIKTKDFVAVMDNFDVRKALIVTEDKIVNLEKSSRNVPGVKVMRYEGMNVYDVLNHDKLFIEQPALGKIQEALIP